MSTDEEPIQAPVDAPMSAPQSNKRKASDAGAYEKETTATSPKRAKLDSPVAELSTATPADRQDAAPQNGDTSTDAKVAHSEVSLDQGPSPSSPHPPPRSASPRPSRSPTLARRPSIPTTERRPSATGAVSGPNRDSAGGGRSRISEQEKKRGQRLFGGLLSTLSQRAGGGRAGVSNNSSEQQKKRAEVERRQQERAAQQRAEDEKRRAERLAELTRARKIEQVRLDEQVMQTRHKNLLLQARSLCTRSEPKLFYLPWQLTASQRLLCKEQVLDAEELIAREVEKFQRKKERRLKELGVSVPPTDRDDDRSAGANDRDKAKVQQVPRSESPPSVAAKQQGNGSTDSASHGEVQREKAGHDSHHDDTGYVVDENEEDTVIY